MRARFKIIAAVLACLGTAVGAGFYVYGWEYTPPLLEIDFLSLSRGHGIFIRLPDKHVVLVDGGESGDIVRELSKLLPFYRRTIDAIFITRPEAKYTGGLIDVLERYEVKEVYMPNDMGTSSAEEEVMTLARDKNIPIKDLSASDSILLEGKDDEVSSTVVMKALFPDDSFKFSNASPPQFVIELSYGSAKVVFVGDSSQAVQNFLAKNTATTSVDILEYANSGGASNASEKLVCKLDPDFIIIKSASTSSKPPKKPQFTVHSYPADIEDIASSSIEFFSDGRKLWLDK